MKINQDSLIPEFEVSEIGHEHGTAHVNLLLKNFFEKMPTIYSTDSEIHWTKLDGYKTTHSLKGRLMGPVRVEVDSVEKVLLAFVKAFEAGGQDPGDLIRRAKRLLAGGA